MSEAKRKWVKNKIQEMLEKGIIKPSASEFAAPCVVVAKKDGNFSLCQDYRKINDETALDAFPFPRIDNIVNKFGGCKYFTKIDLKDVFWQVGITEDTQKYTAFVTPNGLYEYTRLPFGWKNSPPKFQRIMTEILGNLLNERVIVYVDDICCGGFTKDECARLTYRVCEQLDKAGMKINTQKTQFCQTSIELLVIKNNADTKRMKEETIEKVKNMKRPHNLKAVQCFTGLTGHFRCYIQNYAKIVKPLDNLKQTGVAFTWTQECEEAFLSLIKHITSDPILRVPDDRLNYELATDASYYGTGAILYQRDIEKGKNKQLRVISYYSYTLTKAEQNYSVTEKECLAVLKAVKFFKAYLDGRNFIVHTDHRALTQLLTCGDLKDRLARWQLFLRSFEMTINHKAGKELKDADAISRLCIEPQENKTDQILWTKHKPIDFTLGPNNRYEVSKDDRETILTLYQDDAASGGHGGFWRTYNKMKQRFSWKGMKKDIKLHINSCDTCQKAKFKYKSRRDYMDLPEQSEKPLHTVHIDFAELAKKGEKRNTTQCFLVVIDEATRMVYTKAMKQDGNSIKLYFDNHKDLENVRKIISDNGKSFVGGIFYEWAKGKGIEMVTTTPYHPAGNGLAERTVREIKTFLTCYQHFTGGWKQCLEAATRYHNRSHNSYLGCSPLYKLSGKTPRLPADDDLAIDVIDEEKEKTSEERNKYRQRMKTYYNSKHKKDPQTIQVDDLVLVQHQVIGKNHLQSGPHRVTQVGTKNGFTKYIKYKNGDETKSAHVTNITKYMEKANK